MCYGSPDEWPDKTCLYPRHWTQFAGTQCGLSAVKAGERCARIAIEMHQRLLRFAARGEEDTNSSLSRTSDISLLRNFVFVLANDYQTVTQLVTRP